MVRKKCLIVLVGRPNGSGGYAYPSVHPSCTKISPTFKQCLINVVAYYRVLPFGIETLQHSNICLDSQIAWGANNQPSSSETWTWYECSPQEYYNEASVLAVNHVKILRK